MKKRITFVSLILGSILFAACGGGVSKKSYPTHELLGDVPAYIAQYNDVDSILDAEKKKFKEKKSTDMSAIQSFRQKQKEQQAEARLELETSIEKVKASLIGKSVPAVSEAPEYEFEDVKISDISSNGQIRFTGKIKVVQPVKMIIGQAYVNFVYRDKQGSEIYKGADVIKNKDYKSPEDNVGKVFDFSFFLQPKNCMDFAQIVIVPGRK